MDRSKNTGEMAGHTRMRGFVSLFLLIAQVFMTSTVTARPLQESVGGRVLTQVTNVRDDLLTEYIGWSGSSIQFTDVRIDSSVQYIFPLSFAIDAVSSRNVQNAVFSPFWASSLTPEAAASFVQAKPNNRLVASLAGFSQFIDAQATRNVDWSDPSDTNAWITNAVNSITSLAQRYSLSGIDIDYENFPQSATFTECIGGLITQLKNSNPNFVASIAPFGATLSIYQDLFSNFGFAIDHVNYQFYADGLTNQDVDV